MRKITLILAATVMAFALTACAKNESSTETTTTAPETTTAETTTAEPATEETTVASEAGSTEINAAADVLNNVWSTYPEEEKFFAMGGDYNNMVDGAAGAADITDTETLSFMAYIPVDSIALIDDAATLLHAMNANTFTGAAFHLTDAANAETLTAALKDNIMNAQWMCGFPDTLVIFTVNDEYVVSAFGNAEIIENFKNKVTDVYGESAVLVVEESLI